MRVYFKYNKNTNETSLYGDDSALDLFEVESITNDDDEVLLSVVVKVGMEPLGAPQTIEEMTEFED
tara:strand:+ start:71 stop:268 length:198 start_codon:yes stop_codon:yes gene_type:complete